LLLGNVVRPLVWQALAGYKKCIEIKFNDEASVLSVADVLKVLSPDDDGDLLGAKRTIQNTKVILDVDTANESKTRLLHMRCKPVFSAQRRSTEKSPASVPSHIV
jgi:hypothetical protein